MKKVNALLVAMVMSLLVNYLYFEYTEKMFTKSSIYNYMQSKTQSDGLERISDELEPLSGEIEPISEEIEPILVEMEPIVGDRNIIFIDTTCILNDTSFSTPGLSLTKRQTCAVESAAKVNHDYSVYVLYTCPINGKPEDTNTHERALFVYPNIKLWKLNITRHLADTPLANWDFMKAISSSQWPIEHASHVLRFVTLWKYGGTYLDLDVIVLKSLSELGTNYVTADSAENLGIAVMNFAYEFRRHEVVKDCINEILNDFRGDIWTHNGIRVLSIALFKLCNVSKVSEMSAEKCNGFKVLPKKKFYAISYPAWNHFFNRAERKNVMNKIKDSYGVHMWNRFKQKFECYSWFKTGV